MAKGEEDLLSTSDDMSLVWNLMEAHRTNGSETTAQ